MDTIAHFFIMIDNLIPFLIKWEVGMSLLIKGSWFYNGVCLSRCFWWCKEIASLARKRTTLRWLALGSGKTMGQNLPSETFTLSLHPMKRRFFIQHYKCEGTLDP